MAGQQFEVVIRTGESEARQMVAAGDYSIGRETLCALAAEMKLEGEHAIVSVSPAGVRVKPSSADSHVLIAETRIVGEQRMELPARFAVRDTQVEIFQVGVSVADPNCAIPIETANYEIHGEIDAGGMGRVLDAEDLKLGRTVAMKVLSERADANLDQQMRFVQEAEITGWLEHPNIVPIHDLGKDANGRPFYTMKRVQGQTLQAILNKLKTGDPETIRDWSLNNLLNVFLKVCDAIAFAHSKGVIHRDLKPENIMIGDFGEVLVMDWGLARLCSNDNGIAPAKGVGEFDTEDSSLGITMDGSIIGTPQFMAPEQAEGRVSDLDARADIYSLGAMLHAILTLEPPVTGADIEQVMAKVIAGDVPTAAEHRHSLDASLPHCPRGRAPEALSAVAAKALARKPADRYASARELATDVSAYLRGFGTSVEELSFVQQFWLLVLRHKLVSAMAVLLIVLSAGFIVKVMASEKEARIQKLAADRSASEAQKLQAAAEAATEREKLALAKEKAARAQSDAWLADTYLHFGLSEMEKENYGRAQLWFTHAADLSVNDPPRHQANLLRAYLCSLQPGRPLRMLPPEKSEDGDDYACKTMPHSSGRYTVHRNRDGSRRLFDLENGTRLHPGPGAGGTRAWQGLAFHPDGEHFAAASLPGQVLLRTLAANETIRTIELNAANEVASSLAFSPDGRQLLVGGRALGIYDSANGNLVGNSVPVEGAVILSSFSPSGDRLLTVSRPSGRDDSNVRVWRVGPDGLDSKPLWGPIRSQSSRARNLLDPAFVNGGRATVMIVPGGSEPGNPKAGSILQFHDTESGELLRSTRVRMLYGNLGVADLSPDGTRASVVQGMISLPEGARVLKAPSSHSSFTPDGAWLLRRSDEGGDVDLVVHFGRDGAPLFKLLHGQDHGRHQVASPDMTTLIDFDSGAAPRVWDLQGYPWTQTYLAPTYNPMMRASFSADGKRFIVSADPRNVLNPLTETRAYQSPTLRAAGIRMEPAGRILHASFRPDSRHAAILVTPNLQRNPDNMFLPDGKSGSFQLWDWKSGELVSPILPMPSEPRDLAFHPSGDWAAVVCAAGQVLRINMGDWTVTELFHEPCRNEAFRAERAQPGELSFDSSGESLVVWGLAKRVHVWDVAAEALRFPPIEGARLECFSVKISGTRFATATYGNGANGTHLRNLLTGEVMPSPLDANRGAWTVDISGDGRLALEVRSGSGGIHAWDLTSNERHSPEWAASGPAALVPGTTAVISVGEQGRVKLWDLNSGKSLGPDIRIPHANWAPQRLDVSPDGRVAAVQGRGLHIIDLSPLHADPSRGMNFDDLKTFAEINAGAELFSSGLVKVASGTKLRHFRQQHPKLFQLKPPLEQRRRWHNMRMAQRKLHVEIKPQDDYAYRWHRARRDELHAKIKEIRPLQF